MIMTYKHGLHRTARERGQTLILMLLLLGVAVGAALFSYYRSNKADLDYDQKTTEALAQAKAALIGYAVRQGDGGSARPGDFPCPDTKNDGTADASCTAGRLGRIPWKTLGIPEPKDASGETLWYAVAGPFLKWDDNPNPINSDTRGNITVYASDGATQLNTQAVAVIFAPGPALGSQIRDTTSAACTTSPSSPVARNLCAGNYLETSAGRNNATTNGPFIAGARSGDYNDRALYITTAEFIPNVEQRVARELKAALQTYYNANAHFPFAAAYDDTSGNCARNVRRGRVPVAAGNCNSMSNWSSSLPPWFVNNNKWWQVMYYAVSPDYGRRGAGGDSDKDDDDDDKDKDKDKDRHNSTLDCGGGCLTVDGNTSISALFFTPGTPRGAISRPSNSLADYLEDAQNQDGWGAGANDTYVTPTAKTFDRDRIYTLAGGMSQVQCANNANALLRRVTCGEHGNTVNSQCLTASANLQVCPCAAAATTLVNPPCTNTLNPPQCQSAMDSLRTACGASGSDDDKDK